MDLSYLLAFDFMVQFLERFQQRFRISDGVLQVNRYTSDQGQTDQHAEQVELHPSYRRRSPKIFLILHRQQRALYADNNQAASSRIRRSVTRFYTT